MEVERIKKEKAEAKAKAVANDNPLQKDSTENNIF